MKEIVIISGKGGTGKTSIAASFAVLANNSVIVDCDVDAADLHLVIKPNVYEKHNFSGGKTAKIDPDKCLECGICQKLCRFDSVVLDKKSYHIDELACEGCRVCAHCCPANAIEMNDSLNGEWYISDTRAGTMVHAKLGIAAENSGKLVSLIKEKARDIAKEQSANYIIVDGPPGIGCPVIASISGASQVVIVTEPSVSGIHDMKRIISLAQHFKVDASVIVNKYDINEEKTAEIKAFAELNNIQILSFLPFDNKITDAQISEQTIVEFSKESEATINIKKAWRQIS